MANWPKPPGQPKITHYKRKEVGIVAVDTDRPIPAPDRQWLKGTVAEWVEYWESDVSGLVNTASDLSAVRRLFNYRDEHARAVVAFRKNRQPGVGSQGQAKVSPDGQLMMKLEALILSLEDRYGLSPTARLRLGAELGGATKSLNEMNEALEARFAGAQQQDDDIEDAEIVDLPGLPKAK